MNKKVAVFGLGRFGYSLAERLYEAGAEVMAIDRDEAVVEKIADNVNYAAVADLSDADAVSALGLFDIDTAVVAMGSDLTASIMAVMIAKEQGVDTVIAKASDERMGSILRKVGADKIIYPEKETGQRTARLLMSDNFLEFFDIDNNLCILEMKPKKEWIGKNLIELNLREKYKLNVVAVKDNSEMKSFVDPYRPIEEETNLLVVLDKADLKNIQ